jgi:hypothetical protein
MKWVLVGGVGARECLFCCCRHGWDGRAYIDVGAVDAEGDLGVEIAKIYAWLII